MSLSHIVGIVTGGASGLGAATVSALVQKGGRVLIADLPQQFDRYKARFSETNQVDFSETDVTKEDEVKKSLDKAEELFGTPVNTAINCAGLAIAQKTLGRNGPHDLQQFERILLVNTLGTFNMARLAAERMVDGGCIINTASIAAMDGQKGQVAYAASKAAIVGMTLPMARDLASHKIRVMTIAPGLFETPLLADLPKSVKEELGAGVPFPSRLGHPDEFGKLVCSILENEMLNGEVIRLDGALRMPP
mmetsp:Transcript_24488/g.36989  ORF Transcript_24488/g.36989 Transcript_24488/m.36989 type:complete len:249 (+) Transcript_24488:92-838(+)